MVRLTVVNFLIGKNFIPSSMREDKLLGMVVVDLLVRLCIAILVTRLK